MIHEGAERGGGGDVEDGRGCRLNLMVVLNH